MFNLIVSSHNWIDGDNFYLDESRWLEYTKLETLYEIGYIDRHSMNWNIICSLPTLFLNEGIAEELIVHIGYVTDVVHKSNNTALNIKYMITAPNKKMWPHLNNALLNDNRETLEIEDFEFSRNHWAIKPYNLIKFLHHITINNNKMLDFDDEIPF